MDFLITYWHYSKAKDPVKFNQTLLAISIVFGIIAFAYIEKIAKNVFIPSMAFIVIIFVFNIGLSANEKPAQKQS